MLNPMSKTRPPQHEIIDVLSSTARVLLDGNHYKVPLDGLHNQKQQPPTKAG